MVIGTVVAVAAKEGPELPIPNVITHPSRVNVPSANFILSLIISYGTIV